MSGSSGILNITTEQMEETVAVHIQDNGSGVSNENLQHLFEPFFTTKSKVKGTGLGLSVSYNIIKSQGGEIQVRSELNKGTTFSIILPASFNSP